MAQADLKLAKIGLVQLGVKDLARSVAFYRDQLGLTLQNQFEAFAFFSAGGVTLMLNQDLAKLSPNIAGATEIVFSVEDVRAAHEALRARGVQFTVEPRIVTGAMWAANFNDPDGHHLSVFGPERKT